jgi:hypothetical protein
MGLPIYILEAGTEIGIKVGNETNYYLRENVQVYSTEDSFVGLRDVSNDVVIVEAETVDYRQPSEASVRDLVEKIKEILSVVFVDYLTEDEVDAIKNANNPNASNPFATIDDIVTSNPVFTPTINGVTMKEVSQESDFGTPIGGVITLAANTTYFIRGVVACTNLLLINNEGTALLGFDRDKDELRYTGGSGLGNFITVQDVNCEIMNLKLSSTNSSAGDVVLKGNNFNYGGAFNDGRLKV